MARQQRVALALLRTRQTPLEQLTHDPKRETRLKLRAASTQHLVPQSLCAAARGVHKRGLANTGPALDQDNAPTVQQLIQRRQLAVALKQPLHENTLKVAQRTAKAG